MSDQHYHEVNGHNTGPDLATLGVGDPNFHHSFCGLKQDHAGPCEEGPGDEFGGPPNRMPTETELLVGKTMPPTGEAWTVILKEDEQGLQYVLLGGTKFVPEARVEEVEQILREVKEKLKAQLRITDELEIQVEALEDGDGHTLHRKCDATIQRLGLTIESLNRDCSEKDHNIEGLVAELESKRRVILNHEARLENISEEILKYMEGPD